MSNQWFRMYAEFAFDPKVQMLSETLQRRYIMLLCLRCNANSNDNVTLHETLTDENIAFQLRISLEEWQETKHIFLSKNLIDEHNVPVNWDKRQYVSDSSAERVRRYREKKKQGCNVTVTPPDTEADTDTDTEYISTTTAMPEPSFYEKFIMHPDWSPKGKSWDKYIKINGLTAEEVTGDVFKDSIREFISHWITTPKPYTQNQWQHKLAQAIVKKRRFAEAENATSRRDYKQNHRNEPKKPIVEQAKQACGEWIQRGSIVSKDDG